MIEGLLIDLGFQQWQSAAVGLVALLACAALRRRWPRAAHAVVLLALIKCLLPAVFETPFAILDSAASRLRPFGPAVASDRGPSLADPYTWLGAAWLAGFVGLFTGSLIRVVAFRRVVRNGRPATEPAVLNAIDRVARALGMVTPPPVLIARVDGPVARGLMAPSVVLPPACACLSPEQLDAVLSHEFLHHRRKDLISAWLSTVVVTICWFNPVAWALAAQLRALREECCDDDVLASGVVTTERYADALLAVAGATASPGAAGMRSHHPLYRRLARILARPRPARQGLVVALVAILFVVLCLPTSAKPTAPDDHVMIRTVIVR